MPPSQDDKDIDGPVVITTGLKKAYFAINPYYKPLISEVLIPEGLIKSRIEKLAYQIAAFYGNRPYTILVLMKGGYKVFNALNEYLEKIYESGLYYNSVKCEFVRMSSYSGVQSFGEVEVIGLDLLELQGKEILVVDVICEMGLSTSILLDKLQLKQTKSVKLFSLLIKENRTKFNFKVDYIGFQIPPKFVVGFGLDYNENFRDISHIVVLSDSGLDKYKKKKSIFAEKKSTSLILDSFNELDMSPQKHPPSLPSLDEESDEIGQNKE